MMQKAACPPPPIRHSELGQEEPGASLDMSFAMLELSKEKPKQDNVATSKIVLSEQEIRKDKMINGGSALDGII